MTKCLSGIQVLNLQFVEEIWFNVKSEQYYDDGNVVGGGSSVGKWSSGNDESAAIGVQNPAVESGKDEDNDEEMDDDDSSSAEDIA